MWPSTSFGELSILSREKPPEATSGDAFTTYL
jgi:hypothetical protein